MKIALSKRIQKQLKNLPESLLEEFALATEQAAISFGKPHLHMGVGIRKIHRRGVCEFRVGRQWRVVVTNPEPDVLFLHVIGNHGEVQRFLDSL